MNQHLQQFARQLARWTEAIIEHGRTPFRRVDTYPRIDTESGLVEPPLVFWINRQSMMAGGILLLPNNNLDEELHRGRNCAAALGLCHFVTWEVDQVRIWKVEESETVEQQSFPLSSSNHPESFQLLLAEILNSLKLLAVLGAVPASDLSPCYFNNLFQITLQQALPPLIEAYRGQHSEREERSPEDADSCAREANRILLLQILTLLWLDQLPDPILPEKLDNTLELSVSTLPDFLRQALSLTTTIDTPPLPLETAVCFQHLILRLRQLSWTQPAQRCRESLYRLIKSWYQGKTGNMEPAIVQIYPEEPPADSVVETLLSDSASFLAASALFAEISASAPYHLFSGSVFQLDRDHLSGQTVSARLVNAAGITSSKRHEYTIRLRSAWPNRYLKIKTGQPYWFWELIHLLGICPIEQTLDLELPFELLKIPPDETLWSLLCDNFNFLRLKQLPDGNLHLSILRSKKPAESFPLQLAEETRGITPDANPIRFRNKLLLAMTLSTNIYKLLGNGLIWPASDEISADHLEGWIFYRQSHLYKYLEKILIDQPVWLVKKVDPPEATGSTLIPYPEPLLLDELTKLVQTNLAENQSAAIDHCLASLLGCAEIETIQLPEQTKTLKLNPVVSHTKRGLKETIVQQLSAHGIPNFPDQYLYFLDQPELCHYTMVPPLTVKSTLLGQFELEDAEGWIITGYGEELKEILLLCSAAGKTEIELPKNHQQLQELSNHYKKDLNSLYKNLSSLCYSQFENPKSAQKLIKSIWKDLNLPVSAWFKE